LFYVNHKLKRKTLNFEGAKNMSDKVGENTSVKAENTQDEIEILKTKMGKVNLTAILKKFK